MDCAHIPELSQDEFGRDYVKHWAARRVPLAGSMELDLRCNLRCRHCYRDGSWPADPLPAREVIRILDQIADAGTLWLLFTGGEILLRPDFLDIYEHAVRLGLLVTLFTNGTLLTERTADRLADLPPYKIEITLHGLSPEAYEKVTGVPGSHEKCYRAVEILLERRLPLKLKTVLMRTNRSELPQLIRFAEARGVPYRWEAMINPNFDGALTTPGERLSPEEAVDLELSVPGREEKLRDYFEPRKTSGTGRVFACGSGSRGFHIDPYGMMTMCLLLRRPAFSLREMSFRRIWDEMFPPVYDRMHEEDHPCHGCNLVALCGKCPGWSQLETGSMASRVEYLCEVGRVRAKRLGYGECFAERIAPKEAESEALLPVIQS